MWIYYYFALQITLVKLYLAAEVSKKKMLTYTRLLSFCLMFFLCLMTNDRMQKLDFTNHLNRNYKICREWIESLWTTSMPVIRANAATSPTDVKSYFMVNFYILILYSIVTNMKRKQGTVNHRLCNTNLLLEIKFWV